MKYDTLRYVGHPSQKYYAQTVRLCDGKGDGMKLLEINNGNGLLLTFAPDRCMDLYRMNYRGDNYGYFSPVGYVAPAYYSDKGTDFFRSFTAGIMTTCGLCHLGSPCEDEGEQLGLHGRINAQPAEQSGWWMETVDGEEVFRIRARMEEARLFGEKLALERRITVHTACNRIDFEDTVINEGDTAQPLMLLYHLNMGYPLLDENAVLHIPALKTVARDARAEEGIDSWHKMQAPEPCFAEQCYYHTVKTDQNGWGAVSLFNPKLNKGIKIAFDTAFLHDFTEWKQLGERDYVLGLEQSNCKVDGRDKVRARGELEFIAPQETKVARFSLEAIDTQE